MSFYIQSVEIGGPRPFYLLGPCSLECESFVWEMARSIKAIAENLDVPLIFKASYDRRTALPSPLFAVPACGKAAAFCRKSAGS